MVVDQWSIHTDVLRAGLQRERWLHQSQSITKLIFYFFFFLPFRIWSSPWLRTMIMRFVMGLDLTHWHLFNFKHPLKISLNILIFFWPLVVLNLSAVWLLLLHLVHPQTERKHGLCDVSQSILKRHLICFTFRKPGAWPTTTDSDIWNTTLFKP